MSKIQKQIEKMLLKLNQSQNLKFFNIEKNIKPLTYSQQVGKESQDNFFEPCYKLKSIYKIEN